MQELKRYIKNNKPRYNFYTKIVEYLKKEGTEITPEGVAINLQLDYDSSRADVVNMAMRVLAEVNGMNEIYNESSRHIMEQLKTKSNQK